MTVKQITAYEDACGGIHKTAEAAELANRNTLLRSIVSRAMDHVREETYEAHPEYVLEFLLKHNAADLQKLIDYEARK